MDVKIHNLTAGEALPVNRPGMFFKLVETAAPVTVHFLKNGQRLAEVGLNVESGYKVFPKDWDDDNERFDGFVLTSAAPQTVTVGVSNTPGDYARSVEQVEAEQTKSQTRFRNNDVSTELGQAFWGSLIAQPAAGQYPRTQLYNPAASGVILLVDQVTTQSSGNQRAELRNGTTPWLTDMSPHIRKKNIAGPAALAQIRWEVNATILLGMYGAVFASTGGTIPLVDYAPFKVNEGETLEVVGGIVAVKLGVVYNWREIPA